MKKLALIPAFLILGACSGDSGGGSSTSAGTGVLSLPKATCGGSVCLASAGSPLRPRSGGSSETMLYMADAIYSYVQETYIPEVNRKIVDVENLFASQGFTKCGGTPVESTGEPMIDAITNGTYPLDSDYTAVVSASDKTSPFSTALEKKFVLRKGLTGFLEVQIGCATETERVIYLRLDDPTTGNVYEAWGHDTASGKTVIAASDVGNVKKNLYFKSTSATTFEVAAVAEAVEIVAGYPQTIAMTGGASLGSGAGKLDLHKLNNTNEAFAASGSGTSYSTTDASMTNAVRHCYSDVETAALTSGTNCSGFFNAIPTADLRDSSKDMSKWNLDTSSGNVLGDAISTTF